MRKENPLGIFGVFAYRIIAYFILYGVLAGVLCYAGIMGFYVVNSSWAAPAVLSSADPQSLDLTEKLVTTRQSLEDLSLDVLRLRTSTVEMKKHKAGLQLLEPQLSQAILREADHNKATGPELGTAWQQKHDDNVITRTVIEQTDAVETAIDRDLAAGLITKGDAAVLRSQLNQTKSAFTDSKISEVLLKDNMLQKDSVGTTALDALDKQAELKSQIAQLDINIAIAEQQQTMESSQIKRLEKAVETATHTPYYSTAFGGIDLLTAAFVPYDNRENAKVGAAVYDCTLSIVICHKVGIIKQIYSSEEHVSHPIFRTDIRGFFVQLELSDPEAARSKTLFLGTKPLLF